VSLVYGVIEAPRRGWGDGVVLVSLAVAVVLLGAFGIWERRCRYPMIDLGLFARPRFLWGTVAATIGTFGLFGLLFTLPQFFQAVQGNDAFHTGLRLLPMMAGLVVGAGGADRVVKAIGTRIPVTAGLIVLAGALALGATTSVESGYGMVATWVALVGFGIGLALAPAMDAVLGELPSAQSGSGTALTMTLRQIGGALGVALLGSVLASSFRDRLDVTGLPGPAATTAADSVSGAVAVAGRLHDGALAASAHLSYVHAMDLVLIVCAVITGLGAVAVAIALPARPASAAAESEHELARVA
jgi:hypothetical protein